MKNIKPKHEIADVLHLYQADFTTNHKTTNQVLRTFGAIKSCRTSTLGGHKKVCTSCGEIKISYNSCRNRHCPKCQAVARERWIMEREAELLEVPYFHVVFTLPHEFNEMAIKNPKEVYNALYKAAWQTIQKFAADPKHLGAKTSMIAVLHTWGQTLSLHPHLHCIIPGGGINKKGEWVFPKKFGKNKQSKYLFPKRALSVVFRAKYMAELRKILSIENHISRRVMEKKWVVYAKQPFLGPKAVIEYLGRYTHKVAISNHRILAISNGQITFKYKDYRTQGSSKTMTLKASEFIRRFSLHVLPKGFRKMRNYGILSSRSKAVDLNKAKAYFGMEKWQKQKLTWEQIANDKLNIDPKTCSSCGKKTMVVIEEIVPQSAYNRGPPLMIKVAKLIWES